jgi:hypothetical protein
MGQRHKEISLMAGPLPHTSEVQSMMSEYLEDALTIIRTQFRRLKKLSEFRAIYRVCLAADAALSKLQSNRMRPNLKAARSIVRRIPLIVGVGQLAVGRIELRRFIELLFWTTYFTDHPIEWANFASNPAAGYGKSLDNPIDFCARRESTFYANYAKERMNEEPSGLGAEAVHSLRRALRELNSIVHPGGIATSKLRIPPFEEVGKDSLVEFSRSLRGVLGHGCILAAAINRRGFDRFPPMHRAHLDWLIGIEKSKKLREGAFGLRG